MVRNSAPQLDIRRQQDSTLQEPCSAQSSFEDSPACLLRAYNALQLHRGLLPGAQMHDLPLRFVGLHGLSVAVWKIRLLYAERQNPVVSGRHHLGIELAILPPPPGLELSRPPPQPPAIHKPSRPRTRTRSRALPAGGTDRTVQFTAIIPHRDFNRRARSRT